MRVLIYGTGGVGGMIGARLWQVGTDVTFLARGIHLASMRSNGLRLESPLGSVTANASFVESVEGLTPFDLIVIAVKSFDTEETAARCSAVTHERTIILTIQNGVENPAILSWVLGGRRILASASYISSFIDSPGIVRHVGGIPRFRMGPFQSLPAAECNRVVELFHKAGFQAQSEADIMRVLWEKLIFISGLGGMTAYTRRPLGAILASPELAGMLSRVVRESTEVARRRLGIPLDGMEDRTDALYRKFPPETTSSMHYDLLHGKRLELQALNGAVVRFGAKEGIACPANTTIVETLAPFS